ncbi:MAG: amino acid ABC transporter substrate-binding protein [Desulfobulbaceae bacterium]|nr:amino acid ABC transporter substrate-binding protein [Desulfobulbaceae bacterium]
MIKTVKILIVLILITMCFIGFAFAEKEKLIFATHPFPPFKYVAENGDIVGCDVEIVKQIVTRLGYDFKIKSLPFQRALFNVSKGKMTGYISFTKNPERLKTYYFSSPISTIKDVFFKQKKNDINWDKLDDLKEYRVDYTKNYNYAPVFLDAIKQNKFQPVYIIGSEEAEVKHLERISKGFVDLAICEISVCSFLIKQHKSKFVNVDFINKAIGPVRTFHVGFSRKWPGIKEFVEKFNADLAKFVTEGKRKAIFEKYGVITYLD